MKIYMVTSGVYSDYGVDGVFSSRRGAEKYIANCKAASVECYCHPDFNDINEMEVDSGLQEREYTRYYASIWLESGDILATEPPGHMQFWGVPQATSYVAEKVTAYSGRAVVRSNSHKSAEHAIKVAAEARQAWLRQHKIPKRSGKD